jgi:hypothetical protein
MQLRFTTEAYREAALKVLLEDANQIAGDLRLPEKRPIETKDLAEVWMNTPAWSDRAGMFGSIATSNYHYFAAQGNRISSVVRNFGKDDVRRRAYIDDVRRRHLTPKARMNTNAAYTLARQWLAAARIDVNGLERDSTVTIKALELGDTFVPLYQVSWRQPYADRVQVNTSGGDGWASVASVEFVEPEQLLLQMHVENPLYIKRKRLAVMNRERLLRQTNDPKMREMWYTTEAYKQEALNVMLAEVNKLCRRLGLLEKLPVQFSNLVEIMIEPPFIADHQGRFATICTDNYVYGADAYKLSYINTSHRFHGAESWHLASLKNRYAVAKHQLNTNNVYMLATQWLAAASVDVNALEREYKAIICPWDLGDGRYVPLFTVTWVKGDNLQEDVVTAATVEVLEPERSLQKLWVEKPEYITSDPLVVMDRDRLLLTTNLDLPASSTSSTNVTTP